MKRAKTKVSIALLGRRLAGFFIHFSLRPMSPRKSYLIISYRVKTLGTVAIPWPEIHR